MPRALAKEPNRLGLRPTWKGTESTFMASRTETEPDKKAQPSPPGATEPEKNGHPVVFPVDSRVVADAGGTRLVEAGHPAFPKPETPKRHWVRWIVIVVVAIFIVGAFARWGLPYIKESMETVSTDDAFVAGHMTNVSARIADVVTEVLVEQYDRVEPGTLLVRLDREPFEIAAAQSRAALDEAEAEVVQARARVRGQFAEARSSFYRRKNAQERIRQQVATLRARVAALKARQSSEWLAKVDQQRIDNLARRGSATQSELDSRNNTLKNAEEQVKEAAAEVQETRALLGLAPDPDNPLDLPKNLEEEQSTIQTAVSDIASSLAQLGIQVDPKNAAEAKAFEQFLSAGGDVKPGEGLESVVEKAPAVRVARATVERARRGLDDANLRLSYTEIRSAIAGYVQDRTVNAGNRVDTGQTLMTVRPDYIWIEANYKETQVQDIRIGQPVDLRVDAYPGRVFQGRVAGFSPGTGLSESLLPPENATGNYVKVTQRLPVRIELVEGNPSQTPLFIGMSVVPHVRFKMRPTGPGAGRKLRDSTMPMRPDRGKGVVGSEPETARQ